MSIFLHITMLVLILQINSTSSNFVVIRDGTRENTLVADLNKSPHNEMYSYSSSNSQVNYNLLSNNKKLNHLFELRSDGRLYTSQSIDREKMCMQTTECCDKTKSCEFALLIAVKSSNEPRTFDLQIRVEDVNDHAPQFRKSQVNLEIKESDPIGSTYPLPMAYDDDSDKFNVKNHEIKYSDQALSLQPHSLPFILDDSRSKTRLNLQLTRKLDRERKDHYSFKLIAKDKGNPPKTGEINIDIRILDVNDNGPKLKKTVYNINQREGAFTNQPLLTIETEDADIGINAELKYKIIDINPSKSEENDYFRIEQSTGEIYLKKRLDYERENSHRFFVEVSNRVYHPLTATATITVNVINFNDEKPEITIDYLNKVKIKAIIKENEKKGTFVALATVIDRDKGKDGQVNCKLTTYTDKFELREKDGSLKHKQYNVYTKVPLDREEQQNYRIILSCFDNGLPVQTTDTEIKVEVKDENDNNPKIVSISKHYDVSNQLYKPYNVKIRENEPINTLVTIIRATDADKGNNGKLIYSIDDSLDTKVLRYFKIDSFNGELRTTQKIDREANQQPLDSFKIKVTVTDMGEPVARSTKLSLTVRVQNVNDNPPKFLRESLVFTVAENQARNYKIGDIDISDRDDDYNDVENSGGNIDNNNYNFNKYSNRYIYNNKLRVSLVPTTNQQSSPFIIVNQNGKYTLNTTRSLDWEREKNFTLKVIAIDGRGPHSHTSSAQIIIYVQDLNDNAPKINFPTRANTTLHSISYQEPAGHDIITITATDMDDKDSPNGRLLYQLQSAPSFKQPTKDMYDLFNIDLHGKISTSRQMTKDDIGQYHIQIIVLDHGQPQRNTSTILTLKIVDSPPSSGGYYNNNRGSIYDTDNSGGRGPYSRPNHPYNKNQYSYSNFWSKEGLLVLSLIILVLFLVICIIMVLYMRHSRGLFPMIPDIIEECCCCCSMLDCCYDGQNDSMNNSRFHQSLQEEQKMRLQHSQLNLKNTVNHHPHMLIDGTQRRHHQKAMSHIQSELAVGHENGTSPMLVHKYNINDPNSPINFYETSNSTRMPILSTSQAQQLNFDTNNNNNNINKSHGSSLDILHHAGQQQLLFNNPNNPTRQYETMNFPSYQIPVTSSNPTSVYCGPNTYDKLFYHHPQAYNENLAQNLIQHPTNTINKLNNSAQNSFATTPINNKSKYPISLSTFCNRIVNNIDPVPSDNSNTPVPLISDDPTSIQSANIAGAHFGSDPSLNKPHSNNENVNKTPNTRRKNTSKTLPNNNNTTNSNPSTTLDTYAVSFPTEQSTFV